MKPKKVKPARIKRSNTKAVRALVWRANKTLSIGSEVIINGDRWKVMSGVSSLAPCPIDLAKPGHVRSS